jgi:UDP-glucose 4-epimerase
LSVGHVRFATPAELAPDLRPPPAAVIGAAGFIGSHLVAALRAVGVPTAAFTRATPLVRDALPAAGLRAARVIFFLASSITPAIAASRPGRVAADQALLRGLLDALNRDGRRPIFVLAGSGGTIYAPGAAPPYTERSPTGPVCAYGRAKLQMEQTLLARADAVRPFVARASAVYGPGQRPRGAQGVLAHWLVAARDGLPLRLFGDPRTCRDYVYVDDVIAAMLAIYRCAGTVAGRPGPEPKPIVNVGSGRPTSLMELLATVVETVPPPLTVRFDPARGFDRGDVWLDVSAGADRLGWRPETPLRKGVAATWQALRQPRWEPVASMARNGVYPSVVTSDAD